jgi:hypothetical protein
MHAAPVFSASITLSPVPRDMYTPYSPQINTVRYMDGPGKRKMVSNTNIVTRVTYLYTGAVSKLDGNTYIWLVSQGHPLTIVREKRQVKQSSCRVVSS